jgi:Flp pilus assembly pilin Flp
MESVQSRRQPAQGLVEFGLILGLVAVVAIAGLLVFGTTVSDLISTLSHTVSFNVNP